MDTIKPVFTMQKKRDAAKANITCAVTIGPREGGGFGIAVKMRVGDKMRRSARIRMPRVATWMWYSR